MNFTARIWHLLYRLLTAFGFFPWISRKVFGIRITTIAGVTIKAAFRFRLFPALLTLLLLAVVVLPLVIKDDGSAQGLTQILLTYTLGSATALLGFSTLWLACGVLARDIEDCTIQTLAVKPVARWEIWLGKWLGIMAVNAMLLFCTSVFIYTSVIYRASKLDPEQREKLKSEILVGRGSVMRPLPDMKPAIDKMMQERLKEPNIAAMDRNFVRTQVENQVKAVEQYVPAGQGRRWEVDFGALKNIVKNRPIQIRVKFNPAVLTQVTTFRVMLQAGPPDTPKVQRQDQALTSEAFHDIPFKAGLLDENGKLTIDFYNMNPIGLSVPMEDGIEVLYPESGFALNFARGMVIIFLWLALLAALGLAAASYLSFPVAAFFSLSILLVCLCSGIMESVVKEGTVTGVNHETGAAAGSFVDYVLVPLFHVLLKVIKLVQDFSPVDSLSSGRSITWLQLLRAVGQIGVLVTGLIGLVGIGLFYRRELATPQQAN